MCRWHEGGGANTEGATPQGPPHHPLPTTGATPQGPPLHPLPTTGATSSLPRTLMTPPLQYFVSSSHPHFANLLQLQLWAHGFVRTARVDDPWRLMWHAGQVDPRILGRLTRGQRINKFPNSGCLTTKSQLWAALNCMQWVLPHYPCTLELVCMSSVGGLLTSNTAARRWSSASFHIRFVLVV